MVRKTEIIDIRVGSTDFDMVADIKKGLKPENDGEKRLPTLLLYDEVHISWKMSLPAADVSRSGCACLKRSRILTSMTSCNPSCVTAP